MQAFSLDDARVSLSILVMFTQNLALVQSDIQVATYFAELLPENEPDIADHPLITGEPVGV